MTHQIDPTVDAKIGRRVQLCREHVGLSVADLAAALRVSPQQVRKYESGLQRLTVLTLLEIAAVLSVAPERLLSDQAVAAGPPRAKAGRADVERAIRAFERIDSREARAAVIEMLESLADPLGR